MQGGKDQWAKKTRLLKTRKDLKKLKKKQIGRKDVRCRHQTDLSIGAYELNEEPGA